MSTRLGRILLVVGAALVLAAAGAALAAALEVKAADNPTLGKIVVNSSGLTLYHNKLETHGKIVCTGSCATTWPPLLTSKKGKLKAGPGVNASRLGRIKRPDGHYQVTYYGEPLYRFAGDSKAGETKGEGLGGVWFALHTSGKIAKASSTSTSTTTSTSTSTTTTTGGTTTSYGY